MAINLTKLGVFDNVNNASGCGVVQLAQQSDARLTKAGTYNCARLLSRAILRSEANETRNNATRESFLQALGATLDIDAEKSRGGKFLISKDFLDKIAKALGFASCDAKDAKKLLGTADFVIKDGHIVGGRPLTERRITAIVNLVYVTARAPRGPMSDATKIGSIAAKFKGYLQRQVADMAISGWHAATDESHRKLLVDVLLKQIGAGKTLNNRLLLLHPQSPLGKAFTKLCSRFAARPDGGTAFDENGFYSDVEFLNSRIHATAPHLKTIDPVGLLRSMNAVDPEVLLPNAAESSQLGLPFARVALKKEMNELLAKLAEWKSTCENARNVDLESDFTAIFKKALSTDPTKEGFYDRVLAEITNVVDEDFPKETRKTRKSRKTGAPIPVSLTNNDVGTEVKYLAAAVYREAMRIRLTEISSQTVEPAVDPFEIDDNELQTLHSLAAQIAKQEMNAFGCMHSTESVDEFINGYASLNRQQIENTVFQSLCKDMTMRKFASTPIISSTGQFSFDPTNPHHRPSDAPEVVDPKVEVPVEDQPGQIATRVAKALADRCWKDSCAQREKSGDDGPVLHKTFIREMNKIATTIMLQDDLGQARLLSADPEQMLPEESPILRIQEQKDSGFAHGLNAASNLNKYFTDNVAPHCKNAYNEILDLVSTALSGPDGLAGCLIAFDTANFGFGTAVNILSRNRSFNGYGAMGDQNVSVNVQMDNHSRPVLVIKLRQMISLQFNQPELDDVNLNSSFGIPKGYADMTMTIPLDQESPGTTKMMSQKLGKEIEVRNPPAFTLDVNIVPNRNGENEP